MDKHEPVPQGKSVGEALEYPAGKWDVGPLRLRGGRRLRPAHGAVPQGALKRRRDPRLRLLRLDPGPRPPPPRGRGALGQELRRARNPAWCTAAARVGLMGVVADEVLARGGSVTGRDPPRARRPRGRALVPARPAGRRDMHARKALMAELADAFVALPGGFGTLEELFEAVTWVQLGIHDKPVACSTSRATTTGCCGRSSRRWRRLQSRAKPRSGCWWRTKTPSRSLDRLTSAGLRLLRPGRSRVQHRRARPRRANRARIDSLGGGGDQSGIQRASAWLSAFARKYFSCSHSTSAIVPFLVFDLADPLPFPGVAHRARVAAVGVSRPQLARVCELQLGDQPSLRRRSLSSIIA